MICKKKVFGQAELQFSAPNHSKSLTSSHRQYFHFWSKNRPQKALKAWDFAFFSGQWGAQVPPPLATLLGTAIKLNSWCEDEKQRLESPVELPASYQSAAAVRDICLRFSVCLTWATQLVEVLVH